MTVEGAGSQEVQLMSLHLLDGGDGGPQLLVPLANWNTDISQVQTKREMKSSPEVGAHIHFHLAE